MRFLIAVLCSLALQGCWWINCVDGKGAIVTETFTDMDQPEIAIGMHAKVTFYKSETPEIKITTYENLFEEIRLEESGSGLIIGTESCIDADETPIIDIYYSELEELKVNGSSDITFKETLITKAFELKINGSGDVILPIETKNLEIKINGSGDVNLSGTSQDTEIGINGSGDINAQELQSQTAEVKINGSGNVRLGVEKALEAKITGSGDVIYYGSPQDLEVKSVGSGNVEKGS